MRFGIGITYSDDFDEAVSQVQDFEKAGIDRIVVAEAYSFDAVSRLGYLAAVTDRVELASGILPMYSRTPTNLAMTAAGLDYVSKGRFVLGIGASGPQVIEGFHGVAYNAPLGRARETAEICRKVWKREPVVHDGKHYQLPLSEERGGSGLGKALKIINRPVRANIPLALAAIGPKNVELAAEVFEEWQPIFLHPDHMQAAFGGPLAAGKAKRDPSLPDLHVSVAVAALITDDKERQDNALAMARAVAALYIGGMGARGKNFYNDLMVRFGYVDEAALIQDLYLDGKKQEAADAVPDELVRAMSLVGSKSEVAEQVARFTEAGVHTALLTPFGVDHNENVAMIETLRSLG